MFSPDQVMDTDKEILEAFKNMGPLLMDQYTRNQAEERDTTKFKPNHLQPQPVVDTSRILRLLSTMVVKMDAEIQALKRQDSFVFFF